MNGQRKSTSGGKRGSKRRGVRRRRAKAPGVAPDAPTEVAAETSLFTTIRELPDLLALARAVRPELRSYDVEAVAGEFLGPGLAGITAPPGTEEFHREAARALGQPLRDELLRLPLAVLTEAAWLVSPLKDALADALAEAEIEVRNTRGAEKVNQKPYTELFTERGELIREAQRRERKPKEAEPLDEELVESILAPGGAVERTLEGYEERPQQLEMARAVARSLGVGRHLMVEGGTGVGKSLAYLVPAALWARRSGRPVVVSTHTKNLQYQLFAKDLPLVRKVFAELSRTAPSAAGGPDEGLKVAVIKGRTNYLCLRQLFHLLRMADYELDDGERVALLPVLTWAVKTETGDLAENSAFQIDAPGSLRDKLTSTGDECAGKRCAAFGRCFLQAARARSLLADVIVANHALVFAELGLDTPVLPKYQEIVFDEAQHVEDVATEHLAVRSARVPVMRVLSRLFRLSRSGTGTGLLATAFEELSREESALPGEFALSAHGAVSAAAEAVRPVTEKAEEFFLAAAKLAGRGRGSGRSYRRRYAADSREGAEWRKTLSSGRALEGDLARLAGLVEAAAEVFSAKEARPIRALREVAQDLKARAGQLRELAENVGFVLAAENEQYVYWIQGEQSRSRRGPFAEFTAAPVAVAPLLREQLFDRKRSVIMTSATLTVAGRFDYIASRAGLLLPGEEEPQYADALAVGSPFDFGRQARVYVPRFLPDPRGEREFVAGLAPLLVELFTLTEGRGMALFTSYSMLEAASDAAKPALAERGVRVLTQGRDGSRERMLDELREGSRVAIFGTASFWEGVDVPGEALIALVVAKLPFHVHTEPLIQARCEAIRQAGGDPFNSYTLPAAVLRLRQGFGRLIRSKRDRGVVVIADGRVLRTGYGRTFIESLPLRVQAAPTPGSLVKAARRFLEEAEPAGNQTA